MPGACFMVSDLGGKGEAGMEGYETHKFGLDCGCSVWEGAEAKGDFILIEHCPKHYVRVRGLSCAQIHEHLIDSIEAAAEQHLIDAAEKEG